MTITEINTEHLIDNYGLCWLHRTAIWDCLTWPDLTILTDYELLALND